jgi:hypothetical protein
MNIKSTVTSRNITSKIYRKKLHDLSEDLGMNHLDAYFNTHGLLNINIVIDNRLYQITLDEQRSAILAKRLLVDTKDRGMKLLDTYKEET